MTKCIALTGGVGGTKLVLGLSKILSPDELLIVVNTGDDFDHLGLTISPDIDTVLYTLAGIANPNNGWGRAKETWETMEALKNLGGEIWFRLGDKDLALHLIRKQMLDCGCSLTEATIALAGKLGVRQSVVPMSDQPVRTMVVIEKGEMPFQEYFVKNRCMPIINGFRYDGIKQASPSPKLLEALIDPALEIVIICPSNPFISIDPILELPGLRQVLKSCRAPVLAVSPIVEGQALKGPASKMLRELHHEPNASSIANHYGKILDAFVIDKKDHNLAEKINKNGHEVLVTQIIMNSLDDRVRLADEILNFAAKFLCNP